MSDRHLPFTHLGNAETVSCLCLSFLCKMGIWSTKKWEGYQNPCKPSRATWSKIHVYNHTRALHVRTFLCILAPQETPSEPPATYSLVNKVRNKKTVSIPSYIEPDCDYDDVELPANMENHHSETTVSSFWQAEEGSRSLF